MTVLAKSIIQFCPFYPPLLWFARTYFQAFPPSSLSHYPKIFITFPCHYLSITLCVSGNYFIFFPKLIGLFIYHPVKSTCSNNSALYSESNHCFNAQEVNLFPWNTSNLSNLLLPAKIVSFLSGKDNRGIYSIIVSIFMTIYILSQTEISWCSRLPSFVVFCYPIITISSILHTCTKHHLEFLFGIFVIFDTGSLLVFTFMHLLNFNFVHAF